MRRFFTCSRRRLHVNSTEVRREWAERSGAYSPEYYAYHGPDARSESVRGLLERFVERDASILELGCSSGRHLSHLQDGGFCTLSGIDVNEDAFDVMAATYPDLAAQGTFYLEAFEDVFGEFDDDQFDVVYSVETLQHVHPDSEWLFEDVHRITSDLLVTVENEGDRERSASNDPAVSYVDDEFPLYFRDWNRVFTEVGFVEVAVSEVPRDTVRAFRPS